MKKAQLFRLRFFCGGKSMPITLFSAVAPGETDVLSQIVKTEMESAIKLSIPLTAEVGVGANWLEAH